jgi:hypothetical protein
MAAMVLMGASPIAAFAGGDDERENSIEVDNDEVNQKNSAAIIQTSNDNNIQGDGSVGVNADVQNAAIVQNNVNVDDDIQVVVANQEISDDECAAVAQLLGFNVC